MTRAHTILAALAVLAMLACAALPTADRCSNTHDPAQCRAERE